MTWAALGRIGPGVRKFAVVSIGTTACFVGAVVWIAGTSGGPSGEALEEKLAQLRAAGYPVTLAEVRGPRAERKEDAVAALMEAERRLWDPKSGSMLWRAEVWSPFSWGRATEAERSIVTAGVTANRTFVDDARAAATLPRWPLDDDGAQALLSERDGKRRRCMYMVGVALGTFAVAAPSAADRQDAIEVLLTMGARLEAKSESGCNVAAIATEAGTESLGAEVARGELRAEEAIQRFDDLLAVPRLEHWRRVAHGVLAGEAAQFASCFGPGQPPRGGGTLLQRIGRFLKAPLAPRPAKGRVEWTAAEVALHLEARRAVGEIPLTPWTEFVEGTEPMVRSVVGARLADDGSELRWPARQLVEHEARCRLARVALAAMAHRERTGGWPASVSELSTRFPAGIPVSPIDGQLPGLVFRDREVTVSFVLPAGLPPSTGFDALHWMSPR